MTNLCIRISEVMTNLSSVWDIIEKSAIKSQYYIRSQYELKLFSLRWSWPQLRVIWTDICTSTWICAVWSAGWMFRWRRAGEWSRVAGDSSHESQLCRQAFVKTTTALNTSATMIFNITNLKDKPQQLMPQLNIIAENDSSHIIYINIRPQPLQKTHQK